MLFRCFEAISPEIDLKKTPISIKRIIELSEKEFFLTSVNWVKSSQKLIEL